MDHNFLRKKSFWSIFFLYQILIINSELFTSYYYFLSIIVFILNVCPIYFYYLNYQRIDYIPTYYYTHIYFFLCYSLALFFPEFVIDIFTNDTRINDVLRSYLSYSDQIVNYQYKIFINALEIYIIGLFFFNLGNYLVEFFLKKKIKTNKTFEFTENRIDVLILGISSYFICLVLLFNNDLEIVKKIYQIKYPLTYLSILSIQLFIIYKKNLSIFFKILLYFLIFSIVFLEMLDGSIANSMLYLISVYLLNFLVTKKIYFKIIICIFILGTFIHAFKYEYRNVVWGEKHINTSLSNYEYAKQIAKKDLDLLDKSKIFLKVYSDQIFNFNLNQTLKAKKNFVTRNLNRLMHSYQSLIVVTALSPEIVPFWDGHSYKIFITKLIPRVIWQNKPSDTIGNSFGTRYFALYPTDDVTSWNMPVLNEFYVNFGLLGIIVGMLLMGMLFKFLPLILYYRYNNFLFLILFITLYPLFYLESHLSLNFGAVIQTFVFLTVYIFLYKFIFIKKVLLIKK